MILYKNVNPMNIFSNYSNFVPLLRRSVNRIRVEIMSCKPPIPVASESP